MLQNQITPAAIVEMVIVAGFFIAIVGTIIADKVKTHKLAK